MDLSLLRPSGPWLACGVLLDLILGDPVYSAHPVRLMGRTLTWCENLLRKNDLDGYGGGVALFFLLTAIWAIGASALVLLAGRARPELGIVLHTFLVYSLLALHDLVRHAWAVETAAGKSNVGEARQAIAQLVGRDVSRMDLGACRRAAIESLSENLTDGFVSPVFWYVVGGLPGLLLFKVVSTMDSMVGYKTPRYLRFGWCGARMDDLMNLVPARLTWLLLSVIALFLPGTSARKAAAIGWRQHGILPGPNSGWSEAAMAGALERKLVGPIWAEGRLVTEIWIGDPIDPPAQERADLIRAIQLTVTVGIMAAATGVAWLWR